MLINYKEKSIGNMEYMHCPEIARKHGISERQVQNYVTKDAYQVFQNLSMCG